MKMSLVACCAVLALLSTDAQATPRHRTYSHADGRPDDCRGVARWCGCYLKNKLGMGSSKLNLNMASEWRHVGSPASPGPGVIVVWRHHVGQIVGPCEGGNCMVESGNDGRQVRTRVLSIRGAIAFRSAY